MKEIFHILKYKIILFSKVNAPLTFSNGLKSLGSIIVYSLFAYGCFLLSQSIVEYLLETVKIGSFLLHRFIMVVLLIFFVTINVGNVVVSYSTLYKSKEVLHLITKPISFTKLFAIKFLDNFFYSSTTLLLIVTAVLIGYGAYFKLSWIFYPAVLFFLILPFMFTAGSAGAIILLVILKLSSKLGIRKVLFTIASVYFGSIIIFYLLNNPINLIEKVFEYYPNINQYFGFLESDVIKFLPNYWIAESLYWISNGRIERAIPFIYANLVSSIFFFGAALFLAHKWYYQTWITSLKLNSELRTNYSFKSRFFRFGKKSILNGFDESIVKREFWMFFREPSQWLHLCVMMFLIIIFISSISGIDIILLNAYNEYLKTIIYLVLYLFNVFLVASLSLRFVFPLISLEGEVLWKVRSAPINFNHLLLKRLLVYLAIIFLIGQVISYFSNFQFPSRLATIAQINSAFITFSLVSLNFGMGGIFANYKEKNPIRLASSQGASITFLFILFYLAILIIILFIPVFNFFQNTARGINYSIWNMFSSTLIIFLLSIMISWVFIRIGLRSFRRDI